MGRKTDRHPLAEKYKNGQCTPEEIRLIELWYKNRSTHELPDEAHTDRASAEATTKALRRVAQLQKRYAIKRIWWQAGTAAAILLLVFTVWKTKERPQDAITTFAHTHVHVQETVTASGEKKELTLPDGSSIVLNAASTIHYPHDFGEGNREILLDGQAFFDVVSDPDRPFIVHTKELTVKVLGTSFDVQAYDTDQQVAVRVATGKVAVSRAGSGEKQLALLHPGEQFGYDKEKKRANTTPVDVQRINDWQKNILHFEFVPLADICKKLERSYGTPIIIENDDILQERYHLSVKGETIDNILILLSKSGKGFSYEKKNGKIIIR